MEWFLHVLVKCETDLTPISRHNFFFPLLRSRHLMMLINSVRLEVSDDLPLFRRRRHFPLPLSCDPRMYVKVRDKVCLKLYL